MQPQLDNRAVRRFIARRAARSLLLLAMLVVSGLVAVAPARAAPAANRIPPRGDAATLSVNPSTVAPGGTVTVSGAGFAAGESIVVALSGLSGALATVQADGSGNLPSTTVTIPASIPAGTYTLIAIGAVSGRVATAALSISTPTASLTLSVGSIEHGGALVATGTGFVPGETITLALSGQSGSLATVQADGSGNLPSTTVTIPASVAAGSYQLTATGASSGRVVTAALTVNSVVLSLSPATVVAGGMVTLSGSGFAPNETVSVTLSGQASALATVQTDGSGNLPATTLTIPASVAAGSYTITAAGANSADAAGAALTVNAAVTTVTTTSAPTVPTSPQSYGPATISISTLSAPQGSTITISGSGFAPDEVITVTLSGPPSAIATLRADSSGNLPASSVAIPASVAPGSYTLSVIGATSGGTATSNLVVLSRTHGLALSSSSTQPGRMITVRGTGFGSAEHILLALNGISLSARSPVISTSAGNFTAVVTIPSTAMNGVNTLVATGASSGISAKATLTVKIALTPRWYVTGASNTNAARSTIALHNAEAQPARVRITFYFANARTYTRDATVPTHGQLSIAVASLGLPSGTFGAEISADRGLKAEVTLTRPGHPSTPLQGVAATSTTWHRATVATSVAQLSILNPDSGAARLQLHLVSGSRVRTVTISVPAHSDDTVSLARLLAGLKGALAVSSNRPLVLAFS